MDVVIEIPDLSKLESLAVPIKVSEFGIKWSKHQLGDYADKSGVYVHFCNSKVLYVGQTTKGQWGTFAERLRREFQEKSSRNSALYNLLKGQNHQIVTAMIDLDEINQLVVDSSKKLSKERKALILEQVLIGVHKPKGNIN